METLANARRIVIKIGSALLVQADSGELRLNWVENLAKDIAELRKQGRDVILVSSGSIALGRRVLKLQEGDLTLEQSQAAAAVGQIQLAQAYQTVLAPNGITTAQVLLTLEDSESRKRYLNSRGTLNTLLGMGVVPIVNENDTVATDEIRFGDNDRLAAQVAAMVGADLLVLLSDVDGIYTANPQVEAGADHIALIDKITPEIEAVAGGAGTATSKGGMKTKVIAARTAMSAGCAMVIMEGDVHRPISALAEGAKHSLFSADADPKAARKSWISGMKTKGEIIIDDGAIQALNSGKSLLAVGVKSVQGKFERGDAVSVLDSSGKELAKGLVSYNAEEAEKIAGKKTSEIEKILGYAGRGALVHRDDLVV